MNKELKSRIRNKKDTATNWSRNNPILLNGEIVVVEMPDGKLRTKIGDGIKNYNSLPFQDEYRGKQGEILGFVQNNMVGAIPNPSLYTTKTQISLAASGWKLSSGKYSQEVVVDGMTEDQIPLVVPQWTVNKDQELVDWNKITEVNSYSGKVVFYTNTAPRSALSVVVLYKK